MSERVLYHIVDVDGNKNFPTVPTYDILTNSFTRFDKTSEE